jgi:exopolysaccharide production protein ExoQ
MSDTLPAQPPQRHASHGLMDTMPGYRQAIAAVVPALYLAYAVLIWPLLYAKQYTADEFTQGATSAPTSSILSTLVFPALCGLAVLLFLSERSRLGAVRRWPLLLLLALWVYLGLSTRWAIVPGASFKDFIVLTLTLLGLGLSTMLVDSIDRLLRPMFVVLALAMMVNLASVLLTPAGPIGHEGIYIHKNDLGAVAAMGLLFALYGLTIRGNLYRLVSLVAIAGWLLILVRSESKTAVGLALLAPLLGLAVTLARQYLRITLSILLVIAIPLILIVVSGGVSGFSQGDLSQMIGGDRTFTGRIEVWDFILQQLQNHPWTGFGFHSFWTGEVGNASPTIHAAYGFLQKAPTAHNGYLEIMLWGGWIALALFGLVMIQLTHWVSQITDLDPAIGWILTTLLIFIGLHNLLESSWFADNSANSIITNVMIMAMIAARPPRQSRQLVQLI